MSGHGFHVHGPHDHELEHAAQHADKDRFAGTIAVMTAILATIGALFSYMGGATQATTALQISIAMAAMALLTRRKWLEWGMFGLAGIGIALGGAAVLHI